MLNTSVSLGRLGVNVYLIGEYGNDFAGDITHQFLKDNHVNTDYVYRYDDGQTTISLAFLQDDNNAVYNFYRNVPSNRFKTDFPEVTEDDIILFGSVYAMYEGIEDKILPFLEKAKSNGALLMYDPNFRKPHYHEIEKLRPKFFRFFEMVDVVRGSNEDFQGIFNVTAFQELLEVFPNKEAVLAYTSAQNGVQLRVAEKKMKYNVPEIKPVSTIGAGDTFNAGIIYGLIKENIKKENLSTSSEESWNRIMELAINFSSQVCLSEDNYLPKRIDG